MTIQTDGVTKDPNINQGDLNRITALEDKYVKALWYAEIGSGTSGTITPPTGGTIVLNEWGGGIDAVISTISTGQAPDFISAKTSGGAIITVTLAANGAWTLSGTPGAYPVAIVYVYEIKLINFDRTKSLYEEIVTVVPGSIGFSATDKILGRATSGAGAGEEIACTAAGRALLDDADAAAQRTTLGLGTIATQNANNVTISGGAITGITDLAVADGGTGASTAAEAATNLGLGTGNSPTFVTAKLTALTDGYIPYHVAAATGLANSPICISGAMVGIGVVPVGFALQVDKGALDDVLKLRTTRNTSVASLMSFYHNRGVASVINGDMASLFDTYTDSDTTASAIVTMVRHKAINVTHASRMSGISIWTCPGTGSGATENFIFYGTKFGIGTLTPTSPIQVVGLSTYANNAAAVAAGLTAGAFYRNNADPDVVCVVH